MLSWDWEWGGGVWSWVLVLRILSTWVFILEFSYAVFSPCVFGECSCDNHWRLCVFQALSECYAVVGWSAVPLSSWTVASVWFCPVYILWGLAFEQLLCTQIWLNLAKARIQMWQGVPIIQHQHSGLKPEDLKLKLALQKERRAQAVGFWYFHILFLYSCWIITTPESPAEY